MLCGAHVESRVCTDQMFATFNGNVRISWKLVYVCWNMFVERHSNRFVYARNEGQKPRRNYEDATVDVLDLELRN